MKLTADILSSDNVIYVFDETFTIVEVNDAFVRYAKENDGGPEFRGSFGEGCRLLEVMPERLRPFYRTIYQRALSGEIVEHDYACHTPPHYRLYRLRLLPLDGGLVAAENSLRVERELPDLLGLDAKAIASRYVSPSGMIIQCMHCRRTKANAERDRWDLIPSLIRSRDDRISHGLCLVCLGLYYPD